MGHTTVSVQYYERGMAVFMVIDGHVIRDTYIECPESNVMMEWAEARAAELRRREEVRKQKQGAEQRQEDPVGHPSRWVMD